MEKLERVVMTHLLEGDSIIAPELRAQYAVARVEGRESTGVGFFIDFAVPAEAPRIVPPDLEFGADAILTDGTAVGFILFVRDGALTMLEGYTFGDDPWPVDARIRHWEEPPDRVASSVCLT